VLSILARLYDVACDQRKDDIRAGAGLMIPPRVVKIVGPALVAAAALFAIIMASPSPKPRLMAIAMLGRNGGCSFHATVTAAAYGKDIEAVRDRIAARSRLLRREGPLELVDTPKGQWWVNAGDRSLTFLLSEQEHGVYGAGAFAVQPGDVVLDCGANVGVFTRTALDRGARLVVAIEITPTTIECLRRNFAAEIAGGRVLLCPKGVWNQTTTLEMAVVDPDNEGGNSVVVGRETKHKISVPVTTVDALVSEFHLDKVNFIKMDIEGAEAEALAGAAATIKHFHPRMAISAEHLPGDAKSLPRVVSATQTGYSIEAADCTDVITRVQPGVLWFRYQ
jgi:FkbM family methyltransferase